MTVYIDTSAFYALMDSDDQYHEQAKRAWVKMLKQSTDLFSSNYVLLETVALLQNRIGINSVRSFEEDILPVVHIEWVNSNLHHAGITALLTASRRELSLVDCVSFDLMRRFGFKQVFTLDPHFKEQGFQIIPE